MGDRLETAGSKILAPNTTLVPRELKMESMDLKRMKVDTGPPLHMDYSTTRNRKTPAANS